MEGLRIDRCLRSAYPWDVADDQQEARAAAEIQALARAFLHATATIDSVADPRARFRLASELGEMLRQAATDAADFRADVAVRIREDGKLSLASLAEKIGVSKGRADQITRAAKAKQRQTEEPMTESPATPEPQPVVAAIVTSPLGVLVGKRNDGKPPWTFIAGEIEPGESPKDAGVREVKEETGLLVRATDIIGRRVHPKTGRTMIYMAAVPTHGLNVFVGDEDELAEVRWVSRAEADELLPGMFEPVHDYLAQALEV